MRHDVPSEDSLRHPQAQWANAAGRARQTGGQQPAMPKGEKGRQHDSNRLQNHMQNLQRLHWRMLHNMRLCAVVEMVRETCNMRMVGSIVPTLDKMTLPVLPVMAIFRYNNPCSLHFDPLG